MKRSDKIRAVKQVRVKVVKYNRLQNEAYNKLIKKLGLKPVVGFGDNAIFDYVFNGYATAVLAIDTTFPKE